MDIIFTKPKNLQEGYTTTTIITGEGLKKVCFGSGEPEDMTLARDLNDALFIKEMLVMAYRAGKDGENLNVVEIEDANE
jgi:hypothetical protein